jgi:hypothetical protein
MLVVIELSERAVVNVTETANKIIKIAHPIPPDQTM